MELNETELGIINRAFERMPFPDDQPAIDLLREKLKTGLDSLFDNNGESAENMRLDLEAKEYADKVPTEQELFDKDGEPAQIVSRDNAREVWKVCSALEKYRQDFFKIPQTTPTEDGVRATLADFRLTWQYLTPENKKRMEALAEIIGYELPENMEKRIVEKRKAAFISLQNLGKDFKKKKKGLPKTNTSEKSEQEREIAIIKNKLTTDSRFYVRGFFRDMSYVKTPQNIVILGDMALQVNSLIQNNEFNRPYVRSAEYYNVKADILTYMRDAYKAMGDFKNANQTTLDISKFRMSADRAMDYGDRQNFEKSPASYNFR